MPTSVESFAVGEKRELEEQGAQKVCSTHYTSHLIEMKREKKKKENKIWWVRQKTKFNDQIYIKKQSCYMHPFANDCIFFINSRIPHFVLHGVSSCNWRLINRGRKNLSLSEWPVGVCVLYSVWVQYGWHPGVACFDTYSRPKPTVCLPPTPQVLPSPCPAWLKRMERGNCCLPTRLYSKKNTYAGRSISIPTQLIVRPCYHTHLGPALPAETGLLFLAWNHCMFSIKTSGLERQDAMMHGSREFVLLRKVYLQPKNHIKYDVSMGCTSPQKATDTTQVQSKKGSKNNWAQMMHEAMVWKMADINMLMTVFSPVSFAFKVCSCCYLLNILSPKS